MGTDVAGALKRRLRSGGEVQVLPEGSRITLSCGVFVDGRPQDTPSYRATAHSLGYGHDGALAMCRDHDPLHALLCDWLGLGDSYSLRCAAGLRAEDDISAAEEAAVLAVQRFMRLADIDVCSIVLPAAPEPDRRWS